MDQIIKGKICGRFQLPPHHQLIRQTEDVCRQLEYVYEYLDRKPLHELESCRHHKQGDKATLEEVADSHLYISFQSLEI